MNLKWTYYKNVEHGAPSAGCGWLGFGEAEKKINCFSAVKMSSELDKRKGGRTRSGMQLRLNVSQRLASKAHAQPSCHRMIIIFMQNVPGFGGLCAFVRKISDKAQIGLHEADQSKARLVLVEWILL